jgi:hypothetical protein
VNADSIAVIRARIPYVDRRALSEAWFSALHLARADRRPGRRAPRAAAPAPGNAAARPAAVAKSSPASFGPRPLPQRTGGAATTAFGREVNVRPNGRSGGAVVVPFPSRAIRYAPVRASFHVGLDGGRVQIIVRRDGPVLHVVAVCSARHVDLVRRALACADLHLRLRGETVRSTVRARDGSA